jgi:CubicO group peptidase (beta-lactamase class C family)
MSIALVDDQRVVWSEGFGYADKSRDIKASADTVYFVGSVSKLFTATAIMQLAEKAGSTLTLRFRHTFLS